MGSLPPSCVLSCELGTPWTQEEWERGQGRGPESLGAEPTYRNDLRTFHLPRTWMKESEMEKLRPWPGRGVNVEPSSSQLRMSRLEREKWRAASAPAWGQPQQGLAHLCTFFPEGSGPVGLLQADVWVPPLPECLLCPTLTTRHAKHFTSMVSLRPRGTGQHCFCSLFTQEAIEPHGKDALALNHTQDQSPRISRSWV